MVCKLQTSLGFRYGSGRPLAGNPASSSDCLTSFSSNPLSEEVIYIYICCSARIGAPHFRNVRGRPFAKIAALARNLSTSLLSNPLSEEVIYIYICCPARISCPSLSERSGSAIREDCCAHSQSFHFAPFESSLRRSNIYIYMLPGEDRRPSLSERSGSAIREDCCAHSQSFHFAPFESSLRRSNIYIYAARRGFEPRTTAPKTGVLPLHHRASCFRISPLLYGLFFYFFYSFCFFSFFGSCYRCGCFLLFILY